MNYNKKSVEDIDVKGKRVLCRCDFNVPTKEGKITSDKRIVAAMPTIEYLVNHGARVILCSHMGKPKGEWKPELSLQVVADRLSELLGKPVVMAKDVVGEDAKAKAAALKDGDVMLLENVRFMKGETKNDPELSKELASLAEIFVNDAFGTAHRAHSSTAGVADYLPAVCGFLVEKEVSIMGKALADPTRPFVAILGGAKVSDKLNVINNLLEKVDTLIIGGGMAYTFLAAKGYSVGKSLLDNEKIDYCRDMMAKAEAKGVRLLLPVDTVVAADFPNPIDADIAVKTVAADAIPDDMEGLDIGEETRKLFADAVKSAKTVVWNGPMGVFENPTLAQGTIAVAQALADSDAVTIVGGGERADDHLVDVLSQSQPHGGHREHHCDAARNDVDEDGVGLPAFQRKYDKEHRQPNDGRAARVRERPPEKEGEGKRDQHIPCAPPRGRGAAQAADCLQLAVRLLQRDLPPAAAPAEGV